MLTTALFGNVNGQLTTSTLRHNSTSSTQSLAPAVTTLAPSQTLGLSPCGRVSSSLSYLAAAKGNIQSSKVYRNQAYEILLATTAYLNPIDCMACLWSIPLHVERSLDFINYVAPFLEFQSTLAYLKNPPIGYPMAGVDLLGGLQEIRTKVKNIDYNNQYEFERQLYSLVNIRPRDFHLNLPLPLIDLFAFSTPDEASLGSISSDGKALPGIYFVLDLAKARALETVLTWKPSPLVTINGRRAEDYVLRAGLESQQVNIPILKLRTFTNLIFSGLILMPSIIECSLLPLFLRQMAVILGCPEVTSMVFHQRQQLMSLPIKLQSFLQIGRRVFMALATLSMSPQERNCFGNLRCQQMLLHLRREIPCHTLQT